MNEGYFLFAFTEPLCYNIPVNLSEAMPCFVSNGIGRCGEIGRHKGLKIPR